MMARQYNPKSFLRLVSNSLLEQYFSSKEALTEINFKELTETKIDPIYEAWLALPDRARSELEKDFKEIDFMATEGATKAIIDEADFHNEELGPILSDLKSHHDRAFWTFLNRPDYWKGALQFYYSDTIPASYWRKRKNIPPTPALVEPEAISRLEYEISRYFHHREGRGKNCRVECYRRNELDYFFAYPEDYAQASIEWVDNNFERKPRTLAFEVIFVYSQKDRTLDTFLRGSKKPVPALQKIFAATILQAPLGQDKEDEEVYNLDPLRQRNFQFVFDPESGIEDVRVRKIRLSGKHGNNERIILEADPAFNPMAVFDLLEKLDQSPVMKLSYYRITQVGLKVYFKSAGDASKPKSRSFDITYPNSCSLKHEGRDLVIRKMLADSGIEPTAESDPSASGCTHVA